MWPFKITPREPKRKPPIAVGERFKYLGVDMVCSRHYDYVLEFPFPVIVAEYLSGHGEIKQVTFYPVDWTALEAERVR